MPSCADVRFCIWLSMTLPAACSRLMPAPMLPRSAATCAIALLMSVSADCAVPAVCRLSLANADAVHVAAGELPSVTPMVLLPAVVESLRYTSMVLELVVLVKRLASTSVPILKRVGGSPAVGQRIRGAAVLGIGDHQIAGVVQGGHQAFARTVDVVDQVAHGCVAGVGRRGVAG